MFNPNRPFELAEILQRRLADELTDRQFVSLERAMALLVDEGFVSSEPAFGMSEGAWRQGRLILWVMRLADEQGQLQHWFPHLDPLVGVDSPHLQIKFVEEVIQPEPWTEEEVSDGNEERLRVIRRLRTAFNSYAFDRSLAKREHLQECLEDIICYIDWMASAEELAIDRAKRWIAQVDRPNDGLFPQLRMAFPRARCPWSEEEIEHLQNAKDYGMDVMSVSGLLLRTPLEVLTKAEEVMNVEGWDFGGHD